MAESLIEAIVSDLGASGDKRFENEADAINESNYKVEKEAKEAKINELKEELKRLKTIIEKMKREEKLGTNEQALFRVITTKLIERKKGQMENEELLNILKSTKKNNEKQVNKLIKEYNNFSSQPVLIEYLREHRYEIMKSLPGLSSLAKHYEILINVAKKTINNMTDTAYFFLGFNNGNKPDICLVIYNPAGKLNDESLIHLGSGNIPCPMTVWRLLSRNDNELKKICSKFVELTGGHKGLNLEHTGSKGLVFTISNKDFKLYNNLKKELEKKEISLIPHERPLKDLFRNFGTETFRLILKMYLIANTSSQDPLGIKYSDIKRFF